MAEISLPVVMLPGMDGTGTLFGPLLAHVEGTAVAYPDAPLGYDDLESLVRSALPKEDFVLLAESFSGPIGLQIGADPPSQMRGLVLVASFARRPRLLPPGLALWGPLGLGFTPPKWAIRAMLTGSSADKGLVDAVQSALCQVSTPTLVARAAAIRDVDVSEQAASLKVPAVYLQARSDRLVPASAASSIPCPLEVIDGAHLLCQTAPVQVAAAIGRITTRSAVTYP